MSGGRVVGDGGGAAAGSEVDLDGRWLLAGLVNAHDHLDFSTFPALGSPPYASVYEWAEDVRAGEGEPRVDRALRVPLPDRLFLGRVRNLLAGVTAVVHHGAAHASLRATPGLPRVLERYGSAHSLGLEPDLAASRRRTPRAAPWMIHVAEGTDARCRDEWRALDARLVLDRNTVMIHGIALETEDMARIGERGVALVWCPESNLSLYGATARVHALANAGVRLGLGSDSPVSGVRDPLSNLAAARREKAVSDVELLDLASRRSAALYGLPAGGFKVGDCADFLVVTSPQELLAGERRSVLLVLIAGRPVLGTPELMAGVSDTAEIRVDGECRRLAAPVAHRLQRILSDNPALRELAWLAGVNA